MGRRGNPVFHFQQFSVWQDQCAMKVGVDGILLGAWTEISGVERILDIGTGTGLVALMLAQRAPQAEITAIEIDLSASQQAAENVARSPWPQRIRVEHIAFQDFIAKAPLPYDLIVANPPFFPGNPENSTPTARSLARQHINLNTSIILRHSHLLLSEAGRVSLIAPQNQKEQIQREADALGFATTRIMQVHPTLNSPAKRVLLEFSRVEQEQDSSHLSIECDRHQYTPEYEALISQFFLRYAHPSQSNDQGFA